MNNFEKIKNMTLDEMALYFATRLPKSCHLCLGQKTGCLREVSCVSGIKGYLQQESEG